MRGVLSGSACAAIALFDPFSINRDSLNLNDDAQSLNRDSLNLNDDA